MRSGTPQGAAGFDLEKNHGFAKGLEIHLQEELAIFSMSEEE
jgi:hypothetical protein